MAEATCLIVNPVSGGGMGERAVAALVARAEAVVGPLDVAVTGGPGEAATLARRAVETGIARILVAGGDGTVGEVVTGLVTSGAAVDLSPIVALLPTGSGCDLARTLGIPRRLDRALALAAAGHFRLLDVGRIELVDAAGNACVRHFANEASAGLSGDTVARAGRFHARLGPRAGFVASALAALATHRPFSARVELDGEAVYDGPISLLAVSNGRHFGAGMCVAPRARVDDGLLEVVLARGLGRHEIALHLPSFYLGRHGGHPQVSFHAARRVRVVPSAGRAAVEVDGEGGFGLPLVAECVAAAVRIVTPEATRATVKRVRTAVAAPIPVVVGRAVAPPVALREEKAG